MDIPKSPTRSVPTRPSTELLRLLWKVELRLEYHREKALALAAVRGAIRTELNRREETP
jgi:hypothetical protein